MSHDKAKAAGVSASSFQELSSTVTAQALELERTKAAGLATTIVGGTKRPGKKQPKWMVENHGVRARAARDMELEEVDRPTLERGLAILTHKAAIYKDLKRGVNPGLSEKALDELNIDLSGKDMRYESDSDDVDESLTVPVAPAQDDPIIDWKDEFGRDHRTLRSEVPPHILAHIEKKDEDDDPYVVVNPVGIYPTYNPTKERIDKINADFAEENNPLNVHYDSNAEVRPKGALHYDLSANEEERLQQQEILKQAHVVTEANRNASHAYTPRAGEIEGMRASEGSGDGVVGTKSRGMEQRKRRNEERLKLLAAKKRKTGKEGEIVEDSKSHSASNNLPPPLSPPAAADPFAALEAQTNSKTQSAEPRQKPKQANDVDTFLAGLEQDMKTRA